MSYAHWKEAGGGVELIGAQHRGLQMNSQSIYLTLVRDIFPINSVCDLGCAAGHWLSASLSLGVKEIGGYDITEMPPEHRQFPIEFLRYVDLGTKDYQPDRRYDLAISTEVAEHLPHESAFNFISNITKFSDVVLFGAAIPYQGGVGHHNENWLEYWNVMFRDRGFQCFDIFRELLWNDPRVFFYYRQNNVLYVKSEASHPLIDKGFKPTERPLSLVHPEMLLQAINRSIPPTQRTLQADVTHYYDVIDAATTADLPKQTVIYGQEDFWFENLAFKR